MSLMQASSSFKKAAIAFVVQFDEATESSVKRLPSATAKPKAEAKVTLKTILRKIKNNEV
jgi:hypothetical protein